MEGKLIKHGHSYALLKEGKLVAFAHPEDFSNDHTIGKLSIKNCEVIERGYDLDGLAIEYFKQIHMGFGILEAYKKGFQKALEVNADKRFTLKEMVDCWNRALEFQTHKETLGEYIKSLQQIGWDVEIEMENISDGLDEMAQPQYYKQPKLDSDGCLILKSK